MSHSSDMINELKLKQIVHVHLFICQEAMSFCQSETLRLIQDPIVTKPEKWQCQICAGIINRRSSFSLSSFGVLCFSLSVCLSHFSTTAWSAMRRHSTSVQLTVYERFFIVKISKMVKQQYIGDFFFYHWCISRFCLYEDALCIISYIYIFVNIIG